MLASPRKEGRGVEGAGRGARDDEHWEKGSIEVGGYFDVNRQP
jgi:hypothetical protein